MGQKDPLYLYYAFYKEVYSPAEQFGDLEMIFPHIASSMGGTISFTFNLQPGVYYIGYYNKLNNNMSLCNQIDDTKKVNINWKGIFSYVQALQTNKDKNKENEILRYINYFLLSENIANENYLALYMKVLAQLSFNYYNTKNENGFKWLYFTIKRMNIQNLSTLNCQKILTLQQTAN